MVCLFTLTKKEQRGLEQEGGRRAQKKLLSHYARL